MPSTPRGRPIAIETELKLAARTGDLPAVRRALEAMAAAPGVASRTSRARLVSTYYDTPDHALARRGSTLRVRRHGRHFVQTVKAESASGESNLARGEWEDRVKGERPDPQATQTGPFLSPEIAGQLRPLFRTEVSRLTIPLAPGPATRIEAAIDRGRIRNGAETPPEPISEVELELKSGASTALYDVALKLLRVAPLRLERRSKAERGYRLAAHADDTARAVHAEPVDLHPGLSGEAVLRRVGRASLDHLLRNEDAALSGDGEGIHQMRVAVRRLRAILSAFAPMLPDEQRRWVSQELRWFGDALGDARNLDVFAGDLLAPARAALPIASEFERLAQATERQRRAAHAAVIKAISSTHYTEALLALLRWLDGGDWHLAAAASLHQPIEVLAPVLLDRCRAKAEKRAKDFSRQSAKKRHRLRIALKKLRYAAELFAPLYGAPEAKQFIQLLKRLQDDLGDANDVRVGREIVKGLTPHGHRSTGIAHAGKRLIAWHKRRIATNEPQLRRHLDELLAAEPFWQTS
ncbi:MAG TPA: CYTH and CHAD domain-containing protein [Stellaceae bacterium]|jgi:triphosphatase|nr:CYTH and CHAD domain-containing protein [Stellaceae bacterium]